MSDPTTGVYFRRVDYASPARRIGACLVDVLLLILVFAGIHMGLYSFDLKALQERKRLAATEPAAKRYVQAKATEAQRIWWPFVILYHIAVRWTHGGTLGYRLMRIRLVNAQGTPPSLRTLVKRFLLACLGVLPLGAAYVSCLRNQRRQAWHDRWAGTWLIRRHAQPAGIADIEEQARFLGAYMFPYQTLVPRVTHLANPALGATA